MIEYVMKREHLDKNVEIRYMVQDYLYISGLKYYENINFKACNHNYSKNCNSSI